MGDTELQEKQLKHNKNMNKESEKTKVLAAIRQCGGNVSFDKLSESTKLGFIELSSMIGLLLKENQLLIHSNPTKEDRPAYKPSKEYLCDRFFRLLSLHHAQERSVTFYASKLCVTPKYLSTVVKKVSGKTPYVWIKEETIKEMEYRLCHTQSSIKEIAYELNFPNCSFFGKFFKAEKGMSPLLYRKTHACTVGMDAAYTV